MGTVMKKGAVKTIIGDKGFGFVTADDGTDIFFHIKTLGAKLFNSLKRGQRVEFETEKTAKGLAVTKLNKIKSEPSQEFFIKPERFIKTRNSDPRRGEVFFRAPVSSRYFKSPDDAEAEVRKQIKYHGANALLNAQMQQERRRNGNYVYRVFKLTGDCALVMEKAHSKSGEACTRSDAQNMAVKVRESIDDAQQNNSHPKIDKMSDDDGVSGASIAFIIGMVIVLMVAFSS